MNLNKHLGINGIFTVKVCGQDHKLRRKSGPSENLILNSGLHGLYFNNGEGFSDCRHACRVGTGSSTPTPEQTSLDSQIGYVTDPDSVSGGRYYDEIDPTKSYHWRKISYAFPQGSVVGNISEVGVSYRNDKGNTYVPNGALFSRALILDENGDPTTITILADEYLFVEYEVRVYPNLNGTITGTASGYSYKMVYADYLSSSSSFNTLLEAEFLSNKNLPGSFRLSKVPIPEPHDIRVSYNSMNSVEFESYNHFNVSNIDYDPNNFTVIKRFTIPPQYGNMLLPDPIKTIVFTGIINVAKTINNSYNYAPFTHFVEFDPPLAKDETNALTIDFLLSWGRYTPPAV